MPIYALRDADAIAAAALIMLRYAYFARFSPRHFDDAACHFD